MVNRYKWNMPIGEPPLKQYGNVPWCIPQGGLENVPLSNKFKHRCPKCKMFTLYPIVQLCMYYYRCLINFIHQFLPTQNPKMTF